MCSDACSLQEEMGLLAAGGVLGQQEREMPGKGRLERGGVGGGGGLAALPLPLPRFHWLQESLKSFLPKAWASMMEALISK